MTNYNFSFPCKVILASASPRRSKLLAEAGFDFDIKVSNIQEDYPSTLKVNEVAPYLAEKKAEASRQFITNDNEIVLAADSVVIAKNKIYGKPTDYQDAFNILRVLSGRKHRVMTGVCLLSNAKKVVFSGVSQVWFDEMTDEEIDFYIQKYQPYDKAGAYAIQEWVGLCKIRRIEGTHFNIMGLPIDLVYKELWKFVAI
jgi:septum formation protein